MRMQVMPEEPLSLRERWIVLILAVLTVLAHFIHLGLMPLHADEAIRATVAFEMMQREDYIVPTLWGEFYYKKPPLYNWILIGFFNVFDSFSEFVFRLPSVIPLMLFGVATWWVARRRIGERAAILAAFAFVLSGRLLTRDSMLGHIDIAYSLLTFAGFYVVYHYWKRSEYLKLFLLSYLLAAAGVLMKGLPSFLFQGLTLLTWFIYKKEFRRLLSPAHFAGIGVFVLIVGGYFYWYSHYNSLEEYFFQLYDQSSQRTVIDRKWYEGLLNIFTFPFENLGHLFPTSLFLLFALRKGTLSRWFGDDFKAFTFLTLVVNLLPYWLSPGYYPRYIFMLYPLAFILGAEAFYLDADKTPRLKKVVYTVFLVIGFLLLPAFITVFVIDELRSLEYALPAAIVLLLSTVTVLVLWFRLPAHRIYWALLFVVFFRFGFDFVVVPFRVYVEGGQHIDRKHHATRIIGITGDSPLQVYRHAPLFDEYAYYLGVAKDTVMYSHETMEPGIFYLAEAGAVQGLNVEEHYRFHLGYKDYDIVLVKLPE